MDPNKSAVSVWWLIRFVEKSRFHHAESGRGICLCVCVSVCMQNALVQGPGYLIPNQPQSHWVPSKYHNNSFECIEGNLIFFGIAFNIAWVMLCLSMNGKLEMKWRIENLPLIFWAGGGGVNTTVAVTLLISVRTLWAKWNYLRETWQNNILMDYCALNRMVGLDVGAHNQFVDSSDWINGWRSRTLQQSCNKQATRLDSMAAPSINSFFSLFLRSENLYRNLSSLKINYSAAIGHYRLDVQCSYSRQTEMSFYDGQSIVASHNGAHTCCSDNKSSSFRIHDINASLKTMAYAR